MLSDYYNRLRAVKDKILLKQIFQKESISQSKMRTAIVRETCIDPKQIAIKKNILGIKNFFDRDNISRATARK